MVNFKLLLPLVTLMSTSFVTAIDERLTIQKPKHVSMALFEQAFIGMCYGFPPAHAPGTAFESPNALFEPSASTPGQAQAYCIYYSPDGSPISMTAGVAQLLGGNTTTPCSTDVCAYQYQADGADVSGTTVNPYTPGYVAQNYSTWQQA